ncbi:MAG: DUF4229 domain-containing protein [Nocardioides sp.]|uniref:DUF4229 domain-containing protein n=1 Tax=Nocardioides sp. TaxID=35761 RepID=UPI0039E53DB5
MKEFWLYTGLRLAIFVATFAIVAGIWLLAADTLNWFYALVISFLVSGVASIRLLNRQRQAFAGKVEAKATRTVEAIRTREDEQEHQQEGGV